MRIEFTAGEAIRAALATIGRTEDVTFSPDGKRLAVAGFLKNRILVIDVEASDAGVALTNHLMLESQSFSQPHGIAWIDNDTIIVANRSGEVPIVRVPAERPESHLSFVSPLQTLRSDETDQLDTPGSLAIAPLSDELFEVLVCNNYSHFISRHLLQKRDFAVVSSEILVNRGLDIPDSIAVSRSARWLAISNHSDQSVYFYRNGHGLDVGTKPDAIARGITFPHGLRFTPDGRSLLVADAGTPFVHVFTSGNGEWSGTLHPSTSIPVLDDDTFKRGEVGPAEGGPKGIDVSRDGRLLVASCSEQPLAFFALERQLTDAGIPIGAPEPLPQVDLQGILLERLASARTEMGALRREIAKVREASPSLGAVLLRVLRRLTTHLRRLRAKLTGKPAD